MSRQLTRDFLLEVARGKISGMFSGNKFGRNIEIDSATTADIWDGGQATAGVSLIWVAPTAARVHQLASTSTSDDGDPVGVGARTVEVFYLPDWDTAETSTTVTMNGTTNVALPSMVMINTMRVVTKGATSSNVGIITATADSDSTITSQIRAGQGRTQQAILGVPSTQKLFIGRLYANVNKAGGAAGLMDMNLCVNPEPADEPINCNIAHTFGLQTVGTSALTINFATWKTIDGPAYVKLQGISNTDNMDVSAGFDYLLVNN